MSNLSGSGTLRGALSRGGGTPSDVYWDDILDKPEFAEVATSGSYNDLTDKPTIPPAQVNADWNATSGAAKILNKPTIPAYTRVPLLQNPVTSSGTANLLDSITNYKQIEVVIKNDEDHTYVTHVFDVVTFTTLAPYANSPSVSTPHFFLSIWQPTNVFARIICGSTNDSIYPFQLNRCSLIAVNGINF